MLVVWRRVDRDVAVKDVVEEEAYAESTSRLLVEMRRWSRLGIEESDERARVILERRGGVLMTPSGPDEPASERSYGAERTLKGLKRCERGREDGRGTCTISGTLSLAACGGGGGGGGCSAGAHDAGRSLLRGREDESGEPRELAWPILEGLPAVTAGHEKNSRGVGGERCGGGGGGRAVRLLEASPMMPR